MTGQIIIGQKSGHVTQLDTSSSLEVLQNLGSIERQSFIPDAIDGDESLSNRPYNPDAIDYELVKSWLRICEESHRHEIGMLKSLGIQEQQLAERQSLGQMQAFDIRLVDVLDQCVITASFPCRYVSLSYTWGHVQQTCLIRANLPLLSIPGGLARVNLSKTVQDATALVAKLGERYLWVDTLCIVQDDEKDRAEQIGRMADVYSNTLLTIVAAQGCDADAGLPRANGRHLGTLSQCEGLINYKETANWGGTKVLESVWASRSWTYQETILSPRVLLVEEQRVALSCEKILFVEGGIPKAPIAHPRLERLLTKLKRRNSLEVYEHVIYVYSRLKLTYEDDVLNAISGVLSMLRPYLRSPCIFGLPETELVSALSWRNNDMALIKEKETRPLRRRKDPKTREDWGPSWSWVGWVGGVHYDYALWPHQEMVFWTVSKDDGSEELMTCEDFRCPPGSGYEEWNWKLGPYDPRFYWHDQEPSIRFANPTMSENHRPYKIYLQPGTHQLQIVALCVNLQITKVALLNQNIGAPSTSKRFPILDNEGFRAGELDVSSTAAMIGDNISEYTKLDFLAQLGSRTEEEEKTKDGDWQLMCLSRFTGMANTQEAPHRGRRQEKEPRQQEHLDKLNNLKIPAQQPDELIDPFVKKTEDENGKLEDEHIWTYDPRRYEREKYYPFYNVLAVQWKEGVAYRMGIGQIHVDAFIYAKPEWRLVILG